MNHKTFNEYHEQQDNMRLVVEWLVANDHDVTEEVVSALMEAGFFDKVRQYGRKAALPLALAAGLGGPAYGGDKNKHPQQHNRPAASAPSHAAPQRAPQPRPQHAPPQHFQGHQPQPQPQHRPDFHGHPDYHRHEPHVVNRTVVKPQRVVIDRQHAYAITSQINRALVAQNVYFQVSVVNVADDETGTTLVLSVTTNQGMAQYNLRRTRAKLDAILRTTLEQQGFHVDSIQVIAKTDAADTVAVHGQREAAGDREEVFRVIVKITGQS